MLLALFHRRAAFLPEAGAQRIGVGGGGDTTLAPLQNRDAGASILQSQLTELGEDLLPLGRGKPGATSGATDRLGEGWAGTAQSKGEGGGKDRTGTNGGGTGHGVGGTRGINRPHRAREILLIPVQRRRGCDRM